MKASIRQIFVSLAIGNVAMLGILVSYPRILVTED